MQPRQKKRRLIKGVTLPQKKVLKEIALTLKEKIKREKRESDYAQVKEILTYLAAGTCLVAAFIMPGTALLLKEFSQKEKKDAKEWRKFNLSYLRRSIERLKKQKLVEIKEENGKTLVKITQAGKRKVLKYALDELEIPRPKVWDRKWRLIIYDIPSKKKYISDLFHRTLKNLGFLALQKSVFLIPYPCCSEIEFLREYFGIGDHVLFLEVTKIENDQPFRDYFGL